MRVIAVWALLTSALFAQDFRVTQVASGLSLPTDIQNAGDGSGRLFCVQQNGLIRILRDGNLAATPFLDITGKTHADGERGLLGLAFPPGFAQKRRFYVDYTDLNGNTVVSQFRVSSSQDEADPASEAVLLRVTQPFANHNGGQIRFGPDGYLYIALGDGGSAGDPQRNGQSTSTLLGKILRVDVESDPGRLQIPPDNPLVGRAGARGEIWALGLRNPWRFSFDRANGDLYIADVGQDQWEEIDFQPASSKGGENYGWNQREGAHCYLSGCSTQGFVDPVAEYSHSFGCSVTGGMVYRGAMSPGMRGLYFYGDYCTGRIWTLERRGSSWNSREILDTNFAISTFGEDEAGEIYVANANNGTIYRIDGSVAPRISSDSVVNASSFTPGISAGSLATAFAAGVRGDPGTSTAPQLPLPLSLDGVSVSVGGIAAPIHSIANVNGQEQVNFQVPFEMQGQVNVPVAVSRDGQSSATVSAAVVGTQPGVFAEGGNAVVVRNVDYKLINSANPLVPGDYAFVYATGLGPVQNQPATGAAAPTSPLAYAGDVRVTVAGINCEVPFAGLAPGFAGVYQVNFRLASIVPSGLQDLVVIAGGIASRPLKIAVR